MRTYIMYTNKRYTNNIINDNNIVVLNRKYTIVSE